MKQIETANIVISINGVVTHIVSFDMTNYDNEMFEKHFLEVCSKYNDGQVFSEDEREEILEDGYFEIDTLRGEQITIDMTHSISLPLLMAA